MAVLRLFSGGIEEACNRAGASVLQGVVQRLCKVLLAGWVWLWIAGGTAMAQEPPLALADLGLTGKLFFGGIETRYAELGNDPRAGAVPNPDFPGDGFRSQLVVVNRSGRLPGVDGMSYGEGTPLVVQVLANGDAVYLGPGPVTLVGSVNGSHRVGRVHLRYARLELSEAGLRAFDAVAMLPPGCGLAVDGKTRTFEGSLPLGRVSLDGDLSPTASELGLSAADAGLPALWFHHESLPLRVATGRIVWKVAESMFEIADGRWEFVRAGELEFLEARPAWIPPDAKRESNDHVLRDARGLGGEPLRLRVDERGLGRLNATVEVSGSLDVVTHFPAGVVVPIRRGVLVMRNGKVDTGASELSVVPNEPMALRYHQGCPDRGCADEAESELTLVSESGAMRWTEDGGVSGDVAVVGTGGEAARLEWGALGGGRFVHSVGGVTQGRLHVPGFRLRGEEAPSSVRDGEKPMALLYAGVPSAGGEGEVRMERLGTASYADGLGDYAGLNVRLGVGPGLGAVSHVAGQRVPATGAYALRDTVTKYYVRGRGVSGRHQAATETFPRDLILYGFRTTLDGLRLSFLDNAVERSATDGGIEVPFPSGFVQGFSDLKLRCNGQLWEANVRGETRHLLEYWLAPIRALTLEFRGASNAVCDTTQGVLLLGAAVTLPGVQPSATGVLGFRSDGRLVSVADAVTGVDSRMVLPASMGLVGPEDRAYALMPVTKATFNAWPGVGGEPVEGFVSFAGKIDLPWFMDAKVQVHALGGGPRPWLHLMGGWNNDGRLDDSGRAWVDEAGRSFFNWQDFDPSNRGYPVGLTVGTYRDSGDERFRVRAQQRLFGLDEARVDFPVAWDSAARVFESAGRQNTGLLVFEMEGEAARVTSRRAQLRFDAGVGTEVPNFSASEFLLGQIEGRTGLFRTVSNAVERALNRNDIADRLRTGADAWDALVSPDLEKLLGNEWFAVVDPWVDLLLDATVSRAKAAGAAVGSFQETLCDVLSESGNGVSRFEKEFLETSVVVEEVGERIEGALRQADDAVTSAITIVESKEVEPGKTRRTVVSEIAKRVVRESGPDASPLVKALAGNVAPGLVDELVDQYLAESIEPTLAEIETNLRDVHRDLDGFIREWGEGRGVFRSGLERAQDALALAGRFHRDATNALCVEFRSEVRPVMEALSDRARLKSRMRRVLLSELLKGVFSKEVHLFLRQYLLTDRKLFRGALEELFQQVHATIVGLALGPLREWVETQAGALDQTVRRGLGQLRDGLEGSRLRGEADLMDDALKRLRVDGQFRFKLGTETMGSDRQLSLDAWYAIEDFQGDGPSRGCQAAGAVFQEVSFGASTTPRTDFASGMRVGLTGRYTLSSKGDLLGVSGGLTATGTKRVGPFAAKDPQLGFSFGKEGHFVGGTVSGRFKDLAFQGRMFVGMGCGTDDMRQLDPEVKSVMADFGVGPADKVVGFYVGGDGSLPLEKFLPTPVPTTCLLSVEARGGLGYFGFGKVADPEAFFVGLRKRYGLKGRILCFLTGEGELRLAGAVGFRDLGTPLGVIHGTLKLSGEVGFCPVCEDITRTLPWAVSMSADDFVVRAPF